MLGMVAGVAALRAARALGAGTAMLKWPNDVVVDERKLCGILLEGDQCEGAPPLVLVGMGMNLASQDELAALGPAPTDVRDRYLGICDLAGGQAAEVYEPALTVLVRELAAGYEQWLAAGAGPALAAWREADALLGARVRAQAAGGQVVGEACGISAWGALRVRTEAGVVEVSSGEVLRVRADQAPR